MSYIHDALKKAQREKDVLVGKCSNIWSDSPFGKAMVVRKWMAPLCIIAVAFAFSSFSWFVSIDDLAPKDATKVAPKTPTRQSRPAVHKKNISSQASEARRRPPARQRAVAPSSSAEKQRSPAPAKSAVVQQESSNAKTIIARRGKTPTSPPPFRVTPPDQLEKKPPSSSAKQEERNRKTVGTTENNSKNTPKPQPPARTLPAKERVRDSKQDDASQKLYSQALALQKNGRLEEAQKLYEVALKKTPNLVSALNNLGAVYVQQNNLDEARKVLEKAIRISPKYADAYYNLACLHARKKDLARGIFYLKKSIAINKLAREWAKSDEDLKNLREHSEYEEIFRNDPKS